MTAEPMRVRIVETEFGSHVEPPLNEAWDRLTKLRWNAAAVEAASGVPIVVREYPSNYTVSVPGSISAVGGYEDAWTLINGIGVGARVARRRLRPIGVDVDAALALHQPIGPEDPALWGDCPTCATTWPCATAEALSAAARPVPVAADVPTPSAATQNDEAQR